MDLKESDILGNDPSTHWYYRSKALAMLAMLDRRPPNSILDVGAGSGFFSRFLLDNTNASSAWCVDTGYPEERDSVHFGKPIHFRRSIENSSADLLLMMDVLEHVDDDQELLREYALKIPRDAIVLVSVPAFQWLWSEHDDFLEHKRRYSLAQLEDLVTRAHLNVLTGAYFFGLLLPVAAASRLPSIVRRRAGGLPRSQLVRHSRFVNEALAHVCAAELRVMRANRLGGLTAFCLASAG